MDTAKKGDLSAVLGAWLQSYVRDNLDMMIPAEVLKFDAPSNQVTVRPVIQLVTTDGELVPRASISGIPVFRFGSGGFFIGIFPKPGDLGWLAANDRDISLFLQNFRESKPNTARMHSFSDAVFFPDAINYSRASVQGSDGLTLQSHDGKTTIHMADSGSITIKGGTVSVESSNVLLGSGASQSLVLWPLLQAHLVAMDTAIKLAAGSYVAPPMGNLGTGKVKGA